MSKDEFLRKAECITVWDTEEKGILRDIKDFAGDVWENLFA